MGKAKSSQAEPTELGVKIYLYKSFLFKVLLSLRNMQLQNLIHDHFCTAENATSHITLPNITFETSTKQMETYNIFCQNLFDSGQRLRLLVLYVIFAMIYSIYSKANTVYTFLSHAYTLVMFKKKKPFFSRFCCTT